MNVELLNVFGLSLLSIAVVAALTAKQFLSKDVRQSPGMMRQMNGIAIPASRHLTRTGRTLLIISKAALFLLCLSVLLICWTLLRS